MMISLSEHSKTNFYSLSKIHTYQETKKIREEGRKEGRKRRESVVRMVSSTLSPRREREKEREREREREREKSYFIIFPSYFICTFRCFFPFVFFPFPDGVGSRSAREGSMAIVSYARE